MSENYKPVNILEQLRKNWVIITFIVGVVVGVTKIQSDIKQNALEIQQLRVDIIALNIKVEEDQKVVNSVTGDIKEIKATLSFIRQAVTQ